MADANDQSDAIPKLSRYYARLCYGVMSFSALGLDPKNFAGGEGSRLHRTHAHPGRPFRRFSLARLYRYRADRNGKLPRSPCRCWSNWPQSSAYHVYAAPRAGVSGRTRELALQLMRQSAPYGKHLSLRVATVFGGVGEHPEDHGFPRRHAFDHRQILTPDGFDATPLRGCRINIRAR